jgi:hypothetical protein
VLASLKNTQQHEQLELAELDVSVMCHCYNVGMTVIACQECVTVVPAFARAARALRRGRPWTVVRVSPITGP